MAIFTTIYVAESALDCYLHKSKYIDDVYNIPEEVLRQFIKTNLSILNNVVKPFGLENACITKELLIFIDHNMYEILCDIRETIQLRKLDDLL